MFTIASRNIRRSSLHLAARYHKQFVKMADTRPVLFFDIDNTLYPKSKEVWKLMGELIDKYFMTHLSLSRDDAYHLHQKYFKDYGLAIEGLVRHHKVDPLEYNAKVDDALPLEDVIVPDPDLRRLLLDFDRSRVKLWLFTNAYITHGKRVTKLLGVEDCFEGITYCDYGAKTFVCKPQPEMFQLAQRDAGVEGEPERCYFIDDSALNCRAARGLGWTTVHLVEPGDKVPKEKAGEYLIRELNELKDLFPDFFQQET